MGLEAPASDTVASAGKQAEFVPHWHGTWRGKLSRHADP